MLNKLSVTFALPANLCADCCVPFSFAKETEKHVKYALHPPLIDIFG